MRRASKIIAVLFAFVSSSANADLTTWEATGTLTVVNTGGGLITEFPTAAAGSPFTLVFTFDPSSGLSSTAAGANGTRYRYFDALVSVELWVDDVMLDRNPEGFASIDIWDNYTPLGLTDPPSDGFNLIWSVSPGGAGQISAALRGPESLDVYSGPGLPNEPSPVLTTLSTSVFQFIEGSDSVVGIINNLTIQQTAFSDVVDVDKLVASDGSMDDTLGYSVAVDGDTAFVAGTQGDFFNQTGFVYVFTRQGGDWLETARLTTSDPLIADNFGRSIAIGGDTALIGAPDDNERGANSGAVYVYTRSNGVWSESAKLTASDGGDNDNFGFAVDLDVDTAVIGAPGDDLFGVASGSAYVFVSSDGVWEEAGKLSADVGAVSDFFGADVAIDGDTVLIGANSVDDDVSRQDTGAVYVFTGSGSLWTQQARLVSGVQTEDDRFGVEVAIDGDTALIGARLEVANAEAGAAYVFTRSGTVWSESAMLLASDAEAGDRFGQAVALNGGKAIIGAWRADDAGESSGSAYVFSGSGSDWVELGKLMANDAMADDRFGFDIAFSQATAVIGAVGDDVGTNTNAGSAYLFRLQTDADGDGIADAFDTDPLIGNNNCTNNDGTNATLVGAAISEQHTTCASKESVDVNGDTNVGSLGDLRLISEEVILTEISVASSGRMAVINADPCPDCSVCGNGTVEAWEQCDDGNTDDGDGCSSACQTE